MFRWVVVASVCCVAAPAFAGGTSVTLSDQAPARDTSALIDTVVIEGLTLSVYAQTIVTPRLTQPVLTVVTSGLAAHGHPELVLSVAWKPGDPQAYAHLRDAVSFLVSVQGAAKAGLKVSAGGRTEFVEKVLGQFSGALYVPADAVAGLAPPEGALRVLFFTREELAATNQTGSYRLVSRWADAYRFYPTTPWNDPARKSLVEKGDKDSVLYEFPVGHAEGVRAALLPSAGMDVTRGTVVVTVPASARQELGTRLGQLRVDKGEGLALLLDPLAVSPGALVWHPGQASAGAVTASDSPAELAGNFVVLAALPGVSTGKVLEDGFGALLEPAEMQRVIDAFAKGEDLDLDTREGLDLRVDFVD